MRNGTIHRCPIGRTPPDPSTYQFGKNGRGKMVAHFHGGIREGCKFAGPCDAKSLKRGGRVPRIMDRAYSTAKQWDKMGVQGGG